MSYISLRTVVAIATLSVTAHAAEPAEFVKAETAKVAAAVKSGDMGSASKAMDAMVDYDAMAKRTFGAPCPTTAACTDHWSELNAAQRVEVTELLHKLVDSTLRKNAKQTSDYDVEVKKASETGGFTKVRTLAKNKKNAREAAVQVDYLLAKVGDSYRAVDIVTEGSSISRNYYTQFHKMLTNPSEGYAFVVKRLREKTSK